MFRSLARASAAWSAAADRAALRNTVNLGPDAICVVEFSCRTGSSAILRHKHLQLLSPFCFTGCGVVRSLTENFHLRWRYAAIKHRVAGELLAPAGVARVMRRYIIYACSVGTPKLPPRRSTRSVYACVFVHWCWPARWNYVVADQTDRFHHPHTFAGASCTSIRWPRWQSANSLVAR